MLRACVVLLLGTGLFPLAAAECPRPHEVASGDNVRSLADFYFGDSRYWPSIVLATNSRSADGFRLIANWNDLGRVPKVCIPALPEAERWRLRYEQYRAAIAETALPEPWDVVPKLVEFPPDRPLEVVTWFSEDEVAAYRTPTGQWVARAPDEIWVTVEPYLRRFCSAFLTAHNGSLEQLTLRLEQRLGLPPVSSKTRFLEIRLNRPTEDVIFRPCMDPSTRTANCPVGPPPEQVDANHKNWIYKQYYSSFGQALLSSFPWTSLGYTFDWASDSARGRFERIGESEFVIHKGAPIAILRATETAAYCAPN
jgi:hypothetical protein